MKYILTLLLFLFNFNLHSQIEKKNKIRKELFFRHQKGFKSFMGGVEISGISVLNKNGVDFAPVFTLGTQLGFGFYPADNIQVFLRTYYEHAFLKNLIDYNVYMFDVGSTYYFRTKKRFSLLLGSEFSLTLLKYTPEQRGYRFYNDNYDNKEHSHYIPSAVIFGGFCLKLGKRFSIPVRIGYSYNFDVDKPEKKFLSHIYLNINLVYNFRSLKRPKKLDNNFEY